MGQIVSKAPAAPKAHQELASLRRVRAQERRDSSCPGSAVAGNASWSTAINTLTQLQPAQSDGDTSFSAALKKLKLQMVMLQCNMHARRKFVEALKNGDKRAKQTIEYYEQIYGIERECDEQLLTIDERTVQRMMRTFLVLEAFREWAQCHMDSGKALPGTPFHKALKYLSTRWLGLTCFVIDGRISIDNGEPERQIRWIAKGRDNWNLCGSPAAAARLAVVASLCATCRRLKINPMEYLTAVFKAIEGGAKLATDAENWTPWAWAARSKMN
jgi:hypothetical protein